MGTNYYARIIPTKERKKQLYNAIETNNFRLAQTLFNEMFSSLELEWENKKIIGGMVHLGKSSGGWKFLWNPNIFVIRNSHLEDVNGKRTYVADPDTALYTYPLTKKVLKLLLTEKMFLSMMNIMSYKIRKSSGRWL